MFVTISDILSKIDDRTAFVPMIWCGQKGTISIPIINTLLYQESTQITYITTERRPIVYTDDKNYIELLTVDELCNDFRMVDNTEITPMRLRQQCLWLSLQDAQAKYREQQYKIYREFTDTRNTNIDLNSTFYTQTVDFTLNNVINSPFGYTYVLDKMLCKRKDIDVLVYEIPIGVFTSFSASSVFLCTTAPMKEYKAHSFYNDIWCIVCPVIDGLPIYNSLTVVSKKTIIQDFKCV